MEDRSLESGLPENPNLNEVCPYGVPAWLQAFFSHKRPPLPPRFVVSSLGHDKAARFTPSRR